MITLQINNPEVENIFLEGFNSDKQSFLDFIVSKFKEEQYYRSFDRSCKQAKLQINGELPEKTLDDLISELENNPNA